MAPIPWFPTAMENTAKTVKLPPLLWVQTDFRISKWIQYLLSITLRLVVVLSFGTQFYYLGYYKIVRSK